MCDMQKVWSKNMNHHFVDDTVVGFCSFNCPGVQLSEMDWTGSKIELNSCDLQGRVSFFSWISS